MSSFQVERFIYCIITLSVVFGTFFQVPQSLLSNSPQKRPTKWCFVMFLWDYCPFPLLPFIHSLPVLLLFCQVMPQVDLWNPLIVCCSPKGKCRQMDLSPTGSFFIIISQAFMNEPLPRKAQGKDIFSCNSFLPHIIFTQFISVSEVLKIKQSVGSEWLNACWMFVILIWHSKWIFAQWPPKI